VSGEDRKEEELNSTERKNETEETRKKCRKGENKWGKRGRAEGQREHEKENSVLK